MACFAVYLHEALHVAYSSFHLWNIRRMRKLLRWRHKWNPKGFAWGLGFGSWHLVSERLSLVFTSGPLNNVVMAKVLHLSCLNIGDSDRVSLTGCFGQKVMFVLFSINFSYVDILDHHHEDGYSIICLREHYGRWMVNPGLKPESSSLQNLWVLEHAFHFWLCFAHLSLQKSGPV